MRNIWRSSARVSRRSWVVALPCGAALTSMLTLFAPSVASAASPPTAPTVLSSSLISVHDDGSVSASVWADGAPAPTYEVTAGSLPSGLSLNRDTGEITGTVSNSPYQVQITASNSAG